MVSTKTSSYGVTGRFSHDSSDFHQKNICKGMNLPKIKYFQEEVPSQYLNKIYCKSSENMDELPDNSVNLMITPHHIMLVRSMMMI